MKTLAYCKCKEKKYTRREKEKKMKETTCWKCDICGTEYKDKKKCEQCEDGHKKKGKIVKMRRLPYTSYPSGYPDKITVKFENGVEKVYSM